MKIIKNEVKEELLNIKIYVKNCKTKDGKRSFKQYHTYMNLIKDGESEKTVCWIQVKFTQSVPQEDLKQITRGGIITCKNSKVNAPQDFYRITKDDNGKDVYPTVWVKEIESYEPYVAPVKQSSFSSEQDHQNHQVETETKETGETVIDGADLVE